MMLPYEFKDLVGRDYKTHHRMMPRDDDDDGDEFEHSDLEAHAMYATLRTMYPIHQFIAPDKARDSMGSDDSEQDAAHNDSAMRSKILSAETFDSEDTPCRMMPEDDDDGDEFEHGDAMAKGTTLAMPIWAFNGKDRRDGSCLRVGYRDLYQMFIRSWSTRDFAFAWTLLKVLKKEEIWPAVAMKEVQCGAKLHAMPALEATVDKDEKKIIIAKDKRSGKESRQMMVTEQKFSEFRICDPTIVKCIKGQKPKPNRNYMQVMEEATHCVTLHAFSDIFNALGNLGVSFEEMGFDIPTVVAFGSESRRKSALLNRSLRCSSSHE